ncbi:phage integrase Arm DNA-binding domain-containing protein, partial [Cronobacter sakazakii]
MAGRPRKRENRHFPDYLYFDKETGQYRFQLITGKRKSIGTDRAVAITIAREYNLRMRPESVPSIESLVRESGGINGEAKPFAEHAQALLERAIRDENPGTDAKAVWLNDIERVKEFFADIYACDIDLEHVNGYIKKYHSEASANVQNRKVSFLKKLFSYAVDESLMMDNPAER